MNTREVGIPQTYASPPMLPDALPTPTPCPRPAPWGARESVGPPPHASIYAHTDLPGIRCIRGSGNRPARLRGSLFDRRGLAFHTPLLIERRLGCAFRLLKLGENLIHEALQRAVIPELRLLAQPVIAVRAFSLAPLEVGCEATFADWNKTRTSRCRGLVIHISQPVCEVREVVQCNNTTCGIGWHQQRTWYSMLKLMPEMTCSDGQ